MSLQQNLLGELKHETKLTTKVLEAVRFENADWKPHAKSMSLRKLASHVAELPLWVQLILTSAEYDFLSGGFSRINAETTTELLAAHEERSALAMSALAAIDDSLLEEKWIVRRGDQVMFDLPRKIALRNFGYNHIAHHRGQLTVYLRLLDIPVPGIYGPSADEK